MMNAFAYDDKYDEHEERMINKMIDLNEALKIAQGDSLLIPQLRHLIALYEELIVCRPSLILKEGHGE